MEKCVACSALFWGIFVLFPDLHSSLSQSVAMIPDSVWMSIPHLQHLRADIFQSSKTKSEKRTWMGKSTKSDMSGPINVVSYAQIVFLKSFYFMLNQPMRLCSPKCAAQNTDCFYYIWSDSMTLLVADWLFYLEGGAYSAILRIASLYI